MEDDKFPIFIDTILREVLKVFYTFTIPEPEQRTWIDYKNSMIIWEFDQDKWSGGKGCGLRLDYLKENLNQILATYYGRISGRPRSLYTMKHWQIQEYYP